MKFRMLESVSGSLGSFVKGWLYETNATCPESFALEQIKIGYAELVEDEPAAPVADKVELSEAKPKKVRMVKAKSKSVEEVQKEAE